MNVQCQGQDYFQVKTYVVVNKLPTEYPPNDWYTTAVMSGVVTCNLPTPYRHQLHTHIQQLQQSWQTKDYDVA